MMRKLWLILGLAMSVLGEDMLRTVPIMTLNPGAKGECQAGFYGFCELVPSDRLLRLAPADASVHVSTDRRILRLEIVTENGPSGILARVNKGASSLSVFMDDCYEIVLVPAPGTEQADYYHMFVNAKGAVYSIAQRAGKTYGSWKPEIKVTSDYKGKQWSMRMDFPLSQFGIKEWSESSPLGLRICRTWRNLDDQYRGGCIQSSWYQYRHAFASAESIPLLYCSSLAPVVDQFSVVSGKERKQDFRLRIGNPTSQSLECVLEYCHRPTQSKPISQTKALALASGETKTMALPLEQILDSEVVRSYVRVRSKDGKHVYFHRAFSWKEGRVDNFFKSLKPSGNRIQTNMAFYPSTNRLEVMMNFAAEKNRSKITSIAGKVVDSSNRLMKEFTLPLPDAMHISRDIVQLPDLKAHTSAKNPSGKYQLLLETKGLPTGNQSIPFERKVFDWEGNSIGKSKRIVPPYTPLRVKGRAVQVLLRQHTFNGLGLWKQVRADGCDLLAGQGMTLKAVIDGKEYQARSTGFDITRKTDMDLDFRADWAVGPIRVHARGHMEYDGVMEYQMTMAPCKETVQSMQLLIPFRKQAAPLMHACTDGLRFNYGGAVPAGTGTVWNSTESPRSNLQTDFVPYIWVGKETSGLSIFADNDRGWQLKSGKPAQEIIRQGDEVLMSWNLLTDALGWTQPKTIAFGMLATPLKPMPKDWRTNLGWLRQWNNKKLAPYFKTASIFCGGCVGKGTYDEDFEPRMGDWTIWKVFRDIRKTGKIPEGFLDKWIAGYPDKHNHAMYRREVNYVLYAMRQSHMTGQKIMLYNNGRGVRLDMPPTDTFQDDWLREEYQPSRLTKRSFPSMTAYSVNPVESFRDYAVKGYRDMIRAGIVDRLYWDNIFLVSCYARNGIEPVYRLPSGELQPSTAVLAMRSLVRRAAVMQLEENMEPENMVHMTNTALMPTMTFAQQALDWEDTDGLKPFQQRYSREYVRAVSSGRQAGCLPCVLGFVRGENASQQERDWCFRTGAGVILTHELRWLRDDAKLYYQLLTKMFDFGYGSPEVTVSNYWDNDYPVDIQGLASSSIYLRKGNRAQLLICSYDKDAQCVVRLKGGLLKQAVNGETGQPLTVKDGALNISLKQHDLIFLELQLAD